MPNPGSPLSPSIDDGQLTLPPGNEGVRRRLVSLVRADRLHHCLIFEGPGGVGKAASARWVAQLVNCDGPPELGGQRSIPCGHCWSCKHISSGQHPDVIEVGPDPKKATRIISVAQARALLSSLALHPFSARLRMVLIDPADAMTVEAGNALLKTFEEPPSQTVFVLVTERPSDLLVTVRSRSQRVRFGPVAPAVVAAWLKETGVEEAEHLAMLSEGCPRRAQELAEGGLKRWRAARDEVVEALDGDVATRMAWSERNARGARAGVMDKLELVFDSLGRLLRDSLVACTRSPMPLYNSDRPQIVEDWAARLGVGGVYRMQAAMGEARADLAANVNARLAIDALFAALAAELGPPRIRR